MKSLIAIFACAYCFTGLCQEASTERTYSSTKFLGKLGMINIDLDDLNQALAHSGYADIGSIFTEELGIAIKSPKTRWGSTWSYIGLRANNNDTRSFLPGSDLAQNRTLRGYGFKVGLDYYLFDQKYVKIYAPVSFQFAKMKLNTFQNIPALFDFSNSNGVEESKFTVWKECVEFGLNLEIGIPLKHNLLILGTNAGYRVDYGNNPWKYSDEISVGFPDLENEGFLFGLTLGLSAIRSVSKTQQ